MTLQRLTLTGSSLLILAVLFVALTMLSHSLFSGARLDLTEDNLYTLSEGSYNIVEAIDEPLNLYFFLSEELSRDLPGLRAYANRVRELLEEYAMAADGKIRLNFIDPVPFSEAEDRATQFGLQGVPATTGGDRFYFGLAGTNAVDGVEVIPFFQPEKETLLEYDISKLIYSLANPRKPVIGLMSSLPMTAGFDPMTQQPRQPWIITEQLQQVFEVRNLPMSAERIEDDVDVLMLVHPKELDTQTQYAIDQFVLGGGHAMIFVDPLAEIDNTGANPQNPAAAMMADRSSGLETLFEAWGISMDRSQILADARYAVTVSGANQTPVRHLGILGLDTSALSSDDPVTTELDTVTMSMPGFLQVADGATERVTPLITSSNEAMPMQVERVRFLPDPAALAQGFSATGEEYLLAARVGGSVSSAFPDGPPEDDGEASDTTDGEGSGSEAQAEHLGESQQPLNLIVVADVDLLSDRLWVRVQNFFGQQIATAWANNGDLTINGLDNLTGNSDLISIRGQAISRRPFTTVEALEREASDRFQATEQQLQEELQETEQKLTELQASREAAGDNALLMSAEQQAELDRFRARQLEIRQELRQVRRELDRDIDLLGNWLTFINIALIPLLISIAALSTLWLRARDRAREVKAA